MRVKEVWLFYCKDYDPNVPKLYDSLIKKLEKKKVKVNIVDIFKEPLLARKFKVMASPILIAKVNNHIERYVGKPEKMVKEMVKHRLLAET